MIGKPIKLADQRMTGFGGKQVVPQREIDTLAMRQAHWRKWRGNSRQFWDAVFRRFAEDEDCAFLRRQVLAD